MTSLCPWSRSIRTQNISNKGLLLLEKKIDVVKKKKKMGNPTNISELCFFLGMKGYYRNFTEYHASITVSFDEIFEKKTGSFLLD